MDKIDGHGRSTSFLVSTTKRVINIKVDFVHLFRVFVHYFEYPSEKLFSYLFLIFYPENRTNTKPRYRLSARS